MRDVYSKFGLTVILVLTLGLALPAARADVKVETLTHFDGIAGMGASDIHSQEFYRGDKKRSESNVKFTGAVLGALQQWRNRGDNGSDSVTIFRVDENKMFTLNPGKKAYREQPIYTPPKPGQEHKSSSSGASQSSQSEKNDVRVVKSELAVKDTGKTRIINGFKTREYLITWNLETENVKTHEHGRSLLTTELWNSDDTRLAAARRDVDNYNRAYARLFHAAMPADLAKQYGMQQFTFLTGKDMKAFTDKMNQIKGYPVASDVKWESGCISNCPENARSQTQDEQSSGSSGGLRGLLAMKAKQNEQANQQQNANGLSTIFSSRTEVQALDTSSLPASLFEVPAGYTKN
ncbi:MAG: hypothetical protein ACRER0_05025 [Gammaproteobacteria bacterium]